MECVTCVCVWLGAVWVERGGEWMRELGLGFTNPVGNIIHLIHYIVNFEAWQFPQCHSIKFHWF